VRGLGGSLKLRSSGDSLQERREKLVSSLDARAMSALRAILDDAAGTESPCWSAATALCLIGEDQDQGRLVRFAIARGVWTRLNPMLTGFPDLNLLDHLILKPLRYPDPHHMLEPYIWHGFGPSQAQRIMARVFVGLAEQSSREGQYGSARWACHLAKQLDPLNLAARRGVRA